MAVATATGLVGVAQFPTEAVSRRPRPTDPFTLGVASGDPTAHGVVLWTRLARQPLAADGLGGMPAADVEVEWEVALDERFRRPVRRGRSTARQHSAHSVHVDLTGLRPGTEYFYRFRAAGHLSPVGRTRTAPGARTVGVPLNLAVTSCAHLEHGWFNVYRAIAADQPELVVFLGDYVYSRVPGRQEPTPHVRTYAGRPGEEPSTLADFRLRYAQHRTDPDLRAAHAAAPWLAVLDDHEVQDNWAADFPSGDQTREQFLARRAAAFQAYYENMPLSRSALPTAAGMRLYRRFGWGGLARFHLLDTRQYRDDQACGDGYRTDCAAAADPARSILGADQERWLLDGLARRRPGWDFLAQQVFFAQRDDDPSPEHRNSNMDYWDGYAACRDRITRGLVERRVTNPVVLTGDIHDCWIADIRGDYAAPDSPTVATELVTPSVTSSGDGSDRQLTPDYLRSNPHLRYYRNRRGYLRLRLTPEAASVQVRTVPAVTDPAAVASTAASFVIESGRPGVQPG